MKIDIGIRNAQGLLIALAPLALLVQSLAAADPSDAVSGTSDALVASGSLRGRTLDSSGAPLAAVKVTIHGADSADHSLLTSSDGGFADNLKPGSYQLTASKQGFADSTAIVVVAQNEIANAQLPLAAAAVRPAPEAGAPRSAELVTTKPDIAPLTERERQLLDRIERLEQRLAAVEGKEAKPAAPSPEAPAAQPLLASINPTAVVLPVGASKSLSTRDLPAALADAGKPVFGSLRGVTLDAAKKPLAAVTVALHNMDGSTYRRVISDGDGVFIAADLKPGVYQIAAVKDGLASPSATTVEIAENRTANANVLLASAAAPADPPADSQVATASAPPAVDLQTPFAFGDFTWLNGTPRNKDVVIDTPFFTPEVRFDTHYMQDFNQPKDHTIGGATESFRSGEIQIEQASVGGDFHWKNVRGRILFMQGLFATTTPRNDASSATGAYPGNTGGVGQWDLQNAYKYVSEAYGGYHFNVNHGLNVDAGIFVSYIGLFSYYNFDNWTYQPSYVSSNTPWFFNGVRVQWFPTNKLKIEPWFINGWQSYAKFNSNPGLGGQLLWMPTEWFKLVANQYGHGQDNLGLRTERLHTDDSIEIRYYNKPESLNLSKMAFSLTADAGIQTGGGLCGTCAPSQGKNSFVGWMLYDRLWFHKDKYAITLGGGQMSNYGRYLTLLPPINGAWASTGSVYFPQLPGQKAHMWDSTVTFHYMPQQYITWWAEIGYRHSDIPYFSGRGGITPPGGNTGAPGQYVCAAGGSAGTSDLPTALTNCGGPGSVWFPDLRRSETKLSFGVMVKF